MYSSKNARIRLAFLGTIVEFIYRPNTADQWTSERTGGRGGIRTHGEFNPTLDFESSAFNRTQPPFLFARRSRRAGASMSPQRVFCNRETPVDASLCEA